ncbi:VanZ family protein [Evansella vedderi]|uniref:VanZ family protein n=1 Tax=Evansella vedderi TaxID=38282 RepID=A0ABT9ZPD3_9BACI|nr:VanZ family protein [Evansella vedderi]MDQ0253101.1 VanZ family protein [Evansella vedderi]
MERFVFLSLIVSFISLAIIYVSIAKETGGVMDLETVRSVYKTDTSLLFFLDRESTFYNHYSLFGDASYMQLRKSGHFFFYGLLAAIIFLLISFEKIWLRGLVASAAASLIGVIDEYHQHFLIDRSGRLLDIYINIAGSITTVVFLMTLWGVMELRKKLLNKYVKNYHKQRIG